MSATPHVPPPSSDALPASGPLAPPRRRAAWRSLLLPGAVVACLLVVYVSPLHGLLAPSQIDVLRADLAALGAWGPAVFVLACAIGIGIGAPRVVFAALGGLAYGWFVGFLLALLGTMLGCLLNFTWARRLRHARAERDPARWDARLMRTLESHPIATNVLVRICPVGNSFATNLVFALSSVRPGDYLLGTLLGVLPETLVYALVGSSAVTGSAGRLLAGASLLAAMTLGWWFVTQRTAAGAAVSAALARRARPGPGPKGGERDRAGAGG